MFQASVPSTVYDFGMQLLEVMPSAQPVDPDHGAVNVRKLRTSAMVTHARRKALRKRRMVKGRTIYRPRRYR